MKKITTGPLTVKSASLVVALGVLTGFSIDRLVIGQLPGLGLTISSLVVAGSVAVIGGRKRPETYVLLAAGSILMIWTMFRTAEYLIAINVIAALILLCLAVTSAAFDLRVWMLRLGDHLRSAFDQFLAVVAGAASPLKVVFHYRSRIDLSPAIPYLRGVAFAIPVFGVFALLLASADSVFSNFLGGIVPSIDISIGTTTGHVLLIALFSWLAVGFYAFAWEPPHASAEGTVKVKERSDRFVEAMVVLCSVAALFALFVAFQFAYLFRASGQIAIEGTTYAEYARQGFFQLLAVSTLTAVMVWVAMLWLRPLTGRRRAMFRAVCTVMVALTAVILASALKRLGLYENAYGYTRLRLLSHVFTFWIAGVLLIVLAQVYTGRLELLPAGAVALGFVVLFGLNLSNPDGYIATHNLERDSASAKDGAIDYITWLSADAVAPVVNRLDSLPPSERSQLRQWVCETTARSRGWREWNLSASRADRAAAPVCAAPLTP
jgi:hypothetical protein